MKRSPRLPTATLCPEHTQTSNLRRNAVFNCRISTRRGRALRASRGECKSGAKDSCRRIVDSYRPAYRLVVEVDGSVHRGHSAFDAARDAELAAMFGVRVLRVSASLVERDLSAAVTHVRAALR